MMKAILNRTGAISFAVALLVACLVMPQFLQAQTVETVPYSATLQTTPHPTYSVCSAAGVSTPPQYGVLPLGSTPPTGAVASCATGTLIEVTIAMQAVLLNPVSGHSYTYQWTFGDGSAPSAVTAVSNPYDLSAQHAYPVTTGANAVGTNYTAVVTVTDTTTSTVVGSANFLVQQQGNTLQVRVNLAIDEGLWYMHETMWRSTSGQTLGSGGSIPIGGWDTSSGSGGACPSVHGADYDGCQGYASQTAAPVQAFEVSGRLPSGPSNDPYTDDVVRGLNRILQFLLPQAVGSVSYQYNPATANFGCSDGTAPTTTNHGGTQGWCGTTGTTEVFYNAGATSCTTPPCPLTFDGNSNGQMLGVYEDGQGEPEYQGGQIIDAIVASGLPGSTTAITGMTGVVGESYANITQDMVDFYEYSQWLYGTQYDVESGYARGSSYGGGAWLYTPQSGNDNSVSQWAAIGMIGARAGYGSTVKPIVLDANNYWVTYSQDVQYPKPSGPDPIASSDNYGAFGYRGSDANGSGAPWGIFADTPSGLVQMSLDSIGRTTNTTLGDGTTAPDQRFNNAETVYADNFCNSIASGSSGYYAPRGNAYGMFSFTKSMLLHNPNGVLSPITYLRTQTAGVFPTPTAPAPANTIDWYGALTPANGGTDACEGIAETIVNRQGLTSGNKGDTNQANPGFGLWYGNSYYSVQFAFETPWSIIMLRQSVFVACISNLYGQGTAGLGPRKPYVTLTFGVQSNAVSYNVLRSTTNGGPYSLVGNSATTTFVDKTAGLANGGTYYYIVQPQNSGASTICASNQVAITIP